MELGQVTGKDGQGRPITLRDELAAVPQERLGPEARALLDGPEMPTAASYLWDWYSALHRARRAGFAGPEAIGFDQMCDWQRLHGITLHPWEIECIEALDMKWREITNRYAEQRRNAD
jgi:hypothetical protein